MLFQGVFVLLLRCITICYVPVIALRYGTFGHCIPIVYLYVGVGKKLNTRHMSVCVQLSSNRFCYKIQQLYGKALYHYNLFCLLYANYVVWRKLNTRQSACVERSSNHAIIQHC